jgi:transposase
MRGRRAPHKRQKLIYKATTHSPDTRNTIGAIYAAMKRLGFERRERVAVLREAGLDLPIPTLDRYVRALEADGVPVAVAGGRGRKPSLTAEQERFFVGWVLHENDRNEIVTLLGSVAFLERTLNLKLSKTTVHDLLHRLGFSSRVAQTSSAGYKLDKTALISLAQNWIAARHADGFFDVERCQLGSIDFTFTSQRTYRPRSYAKRGR